MINMLAAITIAISNTIAKKISREEDVSFIVD